MQDFFKFMSANWGWILSVGGISISFLVYVITQIRAIKKGLQAMLRSQMIDDYNHYTEKGFAPIYARESFENCWVNYEALYKNGVMQDVHTKFMALPTEPPKEGHHD